MKPMGKHDCLIQYVIVDFTDMGAIWRWPYESETFEKEMAELWKTVRPLYEQLHAYVRRKLREKYGKDKVSADGPIPAHLLSKRLNLIVPFAGESMVLLLPMKL